MWTTSAPYGVRIYSVSQNSPGVHYILDSHEAKDTEQKGLTKMLSPGLVNMDNHIVNTFHKYLASA